MVLNDRKGGQWGQEEYQPLIVMQDDSSAVKVFNPGLTTQILIKCEASHFQVSTEATFSYSFFFLFLKKTCKLYYSLTNFNFNELESLLFSYKQ